MALITTGPFDESAPKFDVNTFTSDVMSALVFMAWPQLHPGSTMWAPSEVMSMAATRKPFGEKFCTGPLPVRSSDAV